jgi:hypothetical protein
VYTQSIRTPIRNGDVSSAELAELEASHRQAKWFCGLLTAQLVYLFVLHVVASYANLL